MTILTKEVGPTLEIYKAVSGYWRVKVDGVVDPRLVGFERDVDARAKALLLFPNACILLPTNLPLQPYPEGGFKAEHIAVFSSKL